MSVDVMSEDPAIRDQSQRSAAGLLVHPGYLLHLAYALVVATIPPVLPRDRHPRDLTILHFLAHHHGVMCQRDLAEGLGASPTIMVKVLDLLEHDGLVSRRRDQADRRAYAIAVTPQGRAVLEELLPLVDAAESRLTAGLAGEESDHLLELLAALVIPQPGGVGSAAVRRSLGHLVAKAHFKARDFFDGVVEPLGVGARHMGVLANLVAMGPRSQQELARRLGVSGTMVVQFVDELAGKGLVRRQRDPDDRRSYRLVPTRQGSLVLIEGSERIAQASVGFFAPIGEAGFEELRRLLAKLISSAPPLRATRRCATVGGKGPGS
jgi:DNA-binding MarR family transcriptional regulator